MRSETCQLCKAEVRYGVRDGRNGWYHRERVDHNALFGSAPTVHPLDSLTMRDKWRAEHGELSVIEEAEPDIVPEPEVRSTTITIDDPRCPGGVKRLLKPAAENGWDLVITYSRGPWLHSTRWTATCISDFVVVRLSRPGQEARAMWRDGKFHHAWTWETSHRSLSKIDSRALIERLKESP